MTRYCSVKLLSGKPSDVVVGICCCRSLLVVMLHLVTTPTRKGLENVL